MKAYKNFILASALIMISFLGSIATTYIYNVKAHSNFSGTISNPNVTSEEQNNVEIYHVVSPGVVHITNKASLNTAFGAFPQQGTGSGSIIDKEGHVLTNYHVVKDAQKLEVTLADKSSYIAKLVGADPDNDIAVIQIDAPSDKLHTIALGDSDSLEIGYKVLAIGNPFGLDRTLTTGVISGVDRPLQSEDGSVIDRVIQTDASINPGNSGGPLLNKYGQIIGINTAIYSPNGGSVGIGFAIPINTVKKELPELLSKGSIKRAFLGVTTVGVTPEIAEEFNLTTKEGAMVIDVQPSTSAQVAGLHGMPNRRTPGDVLKNPLILWRNQLKERK
jgi:putative serine protease PepD